MEGDPPADAILIDANLVLWAHHEQFGPHDAARAWLAGTLARPPELGPEKRRGDPLVVYRWIAGVSHAVPLDRSTARSGRPVSPTGLGPGRQI